MRTTLCLALLAVTSIRGPVTPRRQLPPPVASCHHDVSATEGDQNRRSQALILAKAINTAEADTFRRAREYQPLASLGTLPAVPFGFTLKLFADRDDYVFAVKDTRDPCGYAIFSDSAGLLYEKSARSAPVVAR